MSQQRICTMHWWTRGSCRSSPPTLRASRGLSGPCRRSQIPAARSSCARRLQTLWRNGAAACSTASTSTPSPTARLAGQSSRQSGCRASQQRPQTHKLCQRLIQRLLTMQAQWQQWGLCRTAHRACPRRQRPRHRAKAAMSGGRPAVVWSPSGMAAMMPSPPCGATTLKLSSM